MADADWVEVSGTNGQLLKKIITEGTGALPTQGSNLNVHYVGTRASDGKAYIWIGSDFVTWQSPQWFVF